MQPEHEQNGQHSAAASGNNDYESPTAHAHSKRQQSSELAGDFLIRYTRHTRAAYERDLADFTAWLAARELTLLDATRRHVDRYVYSLTEERALAPRTVARRLSVLAGYYRLAVEDGLVARSPLTGVRRPRLPRESLEIGYTREEARLLLDAAREHSPRASALMSLLVYTGMRISEALATDVTDLAESRGVPVLKTVGKGGKPALVPLTPEAAGALQRLLAGRPKGPIFTSRSGRRLDRRNAARLLQVVATTALPHRDDFHPHATRALFVTLSLEAGASLPDVSRSVNHATVTQTMAYRRGGERIEQHAAWQLAVYLQDRPAS